ncbi:MAG: hypothetical protein U1E53_11475 [Dongiaceae bacterium]
MSIAMAAMGMMQVPVHEIVNMTAVRHGLVSAVGAMGMVRLMTSTPVIRRADVRVRFRHLDHMLVHVVAMRMVQMPVMQIVDVIAVPHSGMAAAGAMRVHGWHGGIPNRCSSIDLLVIASNWGLGSTALGRVLYGAPDQAQHMVVRKAVEDMLGITSPGHKTHGKERPQARRDGRQLLSFQLGQLRHAELALAEANENAQALRISQCAQHGGGGGQVIAPRQRSRGTRRVRAVVVTDMG